MIEVTSHYMECTHFKLDYSQMSAVALLHDSKIVSEGKMQSAAK